MKKKKKLIVEFYKDRKGETRFRLIARNGRILASSEGYSSRAKAWNGVQAILTFGEVEFRG